jgi:hypothetical protein
MANDYADLDNAILKAIEGNSEHPWYYKDPWQQVGPLNTARKYSDCHLGGLIRRRLQAMKRKGIVNCVCKREGLNLDRWIICTPENS